MKLNIVVKEDLEDMLDIWANADEVKVTDLIPILLCEALNARNKELDDDNFGYNPHEQLDVNSQTYK